MIPSVDATQSSPSLPSRPSVQIPPSQSPDPLPNPPAPASLPHPPYPPCPPVATQDSEATHPKSEFLNPNSSVPLLTQEERRQILAQIARVNPLDCFDESGAFDLARARRILPPGSIRQLTIQETTRTNAEGQPITERTIQVGLFNPVAALRLDDQIERRRQRDASTSSSPSHSVSDADPDSPPPLPNTPEYGPYLLRQKIRGLEEAVPTLALLKKALAEKQARHRQLRKEREEKDRQLPETPSEVEEDLAPPSREAGFATPLREESNTLSRRNMALQSRDQESDTGWRPVQENSQTSKNSQPSDFKPHSPSKPSSNVADHAPSQAPAYVLTTLKKHETQRLRQEVEDARNSMGAGAFSAWLRRRTLELANDCVRHLAAPPPAKRQKTPDHQPASPSARPPPHV